MSSRRREPIFWTAVLVGLWPAWLAAVNITYASEGYDPAKDTSDDGGITVLLDGIGVFAGVMVAYVVVAAIVYVVLKRLRIFSPPASRR
ncbi:hypothetical protein [Aeromicrobium sp. 9AM]|uniref:hypothetical protein n=1 Tax=Aeromicrobium sp. 9AM TaxID=2653126 RepID=UPI0012F3A41A|nr:hypothetical protein [Aeromicrobium sp. 9AM]VXC38973.1 hypothetical protein AERO9AM_70183 [Aeromicrobium sp. 9AM]